MASRRLIVVPPVPRKRIAGWLVPGDNCTELEYKIVVRAWDDIGTYEDPLTSNRGIRIDEWTKRAGSPPGSWWCAIWAGCVYADCGVPVPVGFPLTDAWLPFLRKVPRPGAMILYGLRRRGPVVADMDAHHIGIVARWEPKWPIPQYRINTVEGNRGFAGTTNNGVAVDFGPVTRADILGYVYPGDLVAEYAKQAQLLRSTTTQPR
jgi:hypothetical protein